MCKLHISENKLSLAFIQDSARYRPFKEVDQPIIILQGRNRFPRSTFIYIRNDAVLNIIKIPRRNKCELNYHVSYSVIKTPRENELLLNYHVSYSVIETPRRF